MACDARFARWVSDITNARHVVCAAVTRFRISSSHTHSDRKESQMYRSPFIALTAALSLFVAGCGDSTTTETAGGSGTMIVRMTDAPFPTDQVQSVDVFVVRVE